MTEPTRLNFKDAVCWRTGLSKKLNLTTRNTTNSSGYSSSGVTLQLRSDDGHETWTRSFANVELMWNWIFEGPDD